MNLKRLVLAAAAGSTLVAAAPAFSEPRDWARGHDRDWRPGHSHYRDHRDYRDYRGHRDYRDRRDHRAPVHAYYPPQQVVVVPAAPVYYAPPQQQQSRPVLSGQIPIGRDRNINIEFQL